MTTIYDTVSNLWKEAVKNRSAKKDIFSLIKNEIKNYVISNRSTGAGEVAPDDDTAITVLKKMAKQRAESVEEYLKAKRQDLADKEMAELEIIKSFLPAAITGEELKQVVNEVLTSIGATTAKDLGKAMKAVMGKTSGRADGKEVQQLVKAALNA